MRGDEETPAVRPRADARFADNSADAAPPAMSWARAHAGFASGSLPAVAADHARDECRCFATERRDAHQRR